VANSIKVITDRVQSALDPQIFYANVGGVKFQAQTATIKKFPGSYLDNILEGNVVVPLDSDGYLFIDRSGVVFRYILEYMRTGRLVKPKNAFERAVLREDLKFYNINVDRSDQVKVGRRTNWKWDRKLMASDLTTKHSQMKVEKFGNNEWSVVFGTIAMHAAAHIWLIKINSFNLKDSSGLILGVLEDGLVQDIIVKPSIVKNSKGIYGIGGSGFSYGLEGEQKFKL